MSSDRDLRLEIVARSHLRRRDDLYPIEAWPELRPRQKSRSECMPGQADEVPMAALLSLSYETAGERDEQEKMIGRREIPSILEAGS